ncbi:MAG: Rpn family recombination-promoting nuclease/putative transposase, partial [Planctomycetaceae bacterium]|nr:Rpn family recombination-promoting nuclease/putative transposase [Planctomycetaceae bacterium]
MKNQKINSISSAKIAEVVEVIEIAEKITQSDPTQETQPQTHERSGNIFDVYLKNTFMRVMYLMDFIRHYAKEGIFDKLNWSTLRLMPTHSFDKNLRERIADLVFMCDLKTSGSNAVISIVIIIEHAGGSLFYLPKRFLEYLVGVWNVIAGKENEKKFLPSPYFMLIRTGTKNMTKEEKEGKYPKTSDMCANDDVLNIAKGLDFDYTVVSLPDIDLEDLLGRPEVKTALGVAKVLTENRPSDLHRALIPLMKCKDAAQRLEVLVSALTLLDQYLKSHDKELDEQLLDQTIGTILKGKEKENMIMSIFDKKILEGEVKGKIEGIIEGEIKGQAKGAAEAVVTILNERFKNVPKPIHKKVEALREQQDASKLLSLV